MAVFLATPVIAAGTIHVNATLDGVAWPGSVNFNVAGPSPISGCSVQLTTPNIPVGNYTLTYLSGGVSGANSIIITPSPS